MSHAVRPAEARLKNDSGFGRRVEQALKRHCSSIIYLCSLTLFTSHQLNRDASMVSRLCASYEAVRDLKIETKIAKMIDK